MEIGKKIKRLRILCGLTQEELANRCELTKGYISQIENDLTSPILSTLQDILFALGTNLGDFFAVEDGEEKLVWGADDYFVKETENQTMKWLVPNSQKNEMEPIMLTLQPHSETTIDMPHEGQEFGYVLEGKILLNVGGKDHVCKKGETFYFNTDKNHFIKNNGNTKAVVIWISSPPNF